jgi:hypothetical protein
VARFPRSVTDGAARSGVSRGTPLRHVGRCVQRNRPPIANATSGLVNIPGSDRGSASELAEPRAKANSAWKRHAKWRFPRSEAQARRSLRTKKQAAYRECDQRPGEYPRQRPTLPQSRLCSTIGGSRLNFRVRNGNGCGPAPMTTGKVVERPRSSSPSLNDMLRPKRGAIQIVKEQLAGLAEALSEVEGRRRDN